MNRLSEIVPVFVEQNPLFKDMENGNLYITKTRGFATHLCACGCGGLTVCGLKPEWKDGWTLTENIDNTVTLRPSIGNWHGQNPYHAHYYITNNKIEWL